MMLEVAGERLALRCLEASSDHNQILWGATLADFLPEQQIGWPCWRVIESISASIPLSSISSPGGNPETFTALLYQRIEQHSRDGLRCGEVMGFFRGFCRAFFHRQVDATPRAEPATTSDSSPADLVKQRAPERKRPDPAPQALESAAPGLLNFNDLLVMLLEWCSSENPDVGCAPPSSTGKPDELIPILVRLIEAMDAEERLDPELLLGGFSSDRCVLRRKRLSYAADQDLETVDVLMTLLSRLHRFYRIDPLALSSTNQP